MAVTGISSTASGVQAQGLGMQDFLKILMTQMMYQDPMKPMDNQQFMAQMAQFTALQQTQEINTKIDQLLNVQAFFQSVGLMGKTIDFTTETGALSGVVSSVGLSGSTPQFTVKTSAGIEMANINLSQITKVH